MPMRALRKGIWKEKASGAQSKASDPVTLGTGKKKTHKKNKTETTNSAPA